MGTKESRSSRICLFLVMKKWQVCNGNVRWQGGSLCFAEQFFRQSKKLLSGTADVYLAAVVNIYTTRHTYLSLSPLTPPPPPTDTHTHTRDDDDVHFYIFIYFLMTSTFIYIYTLKLAGVTNYSTIFLLQTVVTRTVRAPQQHQERGIVQRMSQFDDLNFSPCG